MTVQLKAFQWSCLIHGLFIGAVIGLGIFFKSPPKPLVIHFKLEPAPAQITESRPAQRPAPSKKQPNLQKKASRKAPPIPKERPIIEPLETQVTPFPSEQAVPIFSPPAKPQTFAGNFTGPSEGGGGSTFASGTSGGSASENPRGSAQGARNIEDQAQTRYLREHFAYIRDKILRNIRYPAMARRLGWQGRVHLSFVITLDGSIKEARVMQGSGFEVLDKNVLETVKDTAPFPTPPVEARLVIPITYRLE